VSGTVGISHSLDIMEFECSKLSRCKSSEISAGKHVCRLQHGNYPLQGGASSAGPHRLPTSDLTDNLSS